MSKKISSNVTFVYKYIIPSLVIMITLVLLSSFFVDFLKLEVAARVFLLFFAFIFCLLMIPLIRLHFIYYNNKFTFIKGLKVNKKISNRDVVKVKRFMVYFYRLFYLENEIIKKAIFMPHIQEMLVHFLGKPESIRKYESKIK